MLIFCLGYSKVMDSLTEEVEKAAKEAMERQREEEYQAFLELLEEEYEESERRAREEYRQRKTKPVGDRLENATEIVLKILKREGVIKDFEHLPPRNDTPDFKVGRIGIECKNWNPTGGSVLNKHVVKTKILSRFSGEEWEEKILIIPELKFYERDEKECNELLGDIKIIEGFPWVSPYSRTKAKAMVKILWKLKEFLKKMQKSPE